MPQKYLRTIFSVALCVCVYLCSSASKIAAQGLPVAPPQTVGMNAAKLNQIDDLVAKAIADKKLPGAVVLVGHKGKIVFRKAYGNRSLAPAVEKMTVDTIFDVASLTKPVATATSVMILVEQGKLRLNDTVGGFIPEIQDEAAKRVTIQQLLTHTSGYRPDFDLGEKWTGREGMLEALEKEKLRNLAGTKFVYSDIGFIVLGEIVNRIDNNLKTFAGRNIFEALKMDDTSFIEHIAAQNVTRNSATGAGSLNPYVLRGRTYRIAPTENIKGQQNYLGAKFEGDEKTGNEILRGKVHDPTSFRMGGVAGHAGLFSTADDLARYCQMLLNGGVLDGKRILSAQAVARMTAPYVVSEDGAARGLGWDMNTSFSSNRGDLFPLGSFGHTGFTGTSVWIDRVSETFVVFLSNRVHPEGKGDVTPLRSRVATVVASAIENVPVEAIRTAENVYSAQVAAQIPRFKELVQRSPAVGAQRSAENATVLNGIDVLEKEKFKRLENLRIGLVTNHTGRNLSGKPTIDVLKEAPNVRLVALFAPEHGIRGLLDQEKISDSTDEKTGLPIYSLYGETRKPKQEHLADLDAIVFDIQDIGARFYTYISTLRGVLEEAAKAKKPVFVLDRTNPINGLAVEGALADADKLNFIATHPIVVRHGMTVGELAQMFNAENKIGADVRVVKMENWSRAMWFDETNQIWTNPSPNMRSLTQATLYPGVGLLEVTNVSVGRGTDTPFEIVGAPWLDGQKLALYLNRRNLPGVRFVPVSFKPNASVFKDENVGGVNIIITDRKAFEPVRTGIEMAVALRRLYPAEWQVDRYARLLVNAEILERVRRGDAPEEIEKAWQSQLEEFKKRRASFLLYK
ncbi:MAG TPA: exo-beta-N-acetylmuramidase NamZ domain-containing protein [Pyrinomonadaceae bacterium]|nr:exo-beta-N-acetylmuramidase NamZ domain-containing protein [Pyrinomonadaceae bacterium]